MVSIGRCKCCGEHDSLKKGPWAPEEDEKLVHYIHKKKGYGSWKALPKLAGLNRCGKSCRLRWKNYLRPDIKRGKFSQKEEHIILHLHSILGNKWSTIAAQLPGRTDNEIKNYWNTCLKKKLIKMGFDPETGRPRTNVRISNVAHHLLGPSTITQPPEDQAQYLHLQYNNITDMNNFVSPFNPNQENPALEPPETQNECDDFPFFLDNNTTAISEPRAPLISQAPFYSEPLDCQDSPWVFLSPTSLPPLPPAMASGSNPGGDNASATSSYGDSASSYWSERIFEDPFMQMTDSIFI